MLVVFFGLATNGLNVRNNYNNNIHSEYLNTFRIFFKFVSVYRRYFRHAHFIQIVSVGKRASINWSMVTYQSSTRSELP